MYHPPQRWLNAGGFEAIAHDWRRLLRRADGRTAQPSARLLASRPLPSSPARGPRAGDAGAKRKRGRTVPMAVETLGHLLALPGTPAQAQARAPVEPWTAPGHAGTGEAVEVAGVDQGYTGARPAQAAAAHGLHLAVVTRPEATKGFVRLPRRGGVGRRFAWAARFRRLARDDERLPATLAGFHLLAFAIRLLTRVVALMVQSA